MDGIKRRPHAFAIAQTIEKLDRKRAEVSSVVQALLAFGKFGDDGVAVLLEIFIASTRVHERHGGKIVAPGKVAAKLAAGSFPSAKRLRRRRKASIYAEGVQQAIGWKRMQVTAIGFHRRRARTFAEADLLHRERASFPGNLLAIDGLAVRKSGVHNRILR